MSKIICDICGTSYPETATQCPICGCVRPAEAQGISGADQKDTERTYTYVKGGRFSKANVRKRNKNVQTVAAAHAAEPVSSEDETEQKTGKGLVITAVILLLAIVAIVLYLAVRYFMPFFGVELPSKETTEDTSALEAQTQEVTVPCIGVELDVYSITFTAAGEARMLYVTPNPDDTTDTVEFISDNESVATVNAEGKITAVAPGKATIRATCGSYSATCTIDCAFTEPTEETTEATEEATEDTTAPDTEFMLNRKDITFSRKGDTWMIYDGSIGLSKITWSTDNDKVATVENGRVTAVGSGMTEVHAEYEGQKVSCIIRCSFTENVDVTGSGGGVSEDGGGVSDAVNNNTDTSGDAVAFYSQHGVIENNDTTIKVNDVLNMTLKDASGNAISGVSWSVGNSNCCTVADGVVTGVGSGMTTVTATYNGNTYSCIVRVSG